MRRLQQCVCVLLLTFVVPAIAGRAQETRVPPVAKRTLRFDASGEKQNLLSEDAWRPWKAGYDETADGDFLCDSSEPNSGGQGAGQTVVRGAVGYLSRWWIAGTGGK